MNFFGPLNYAPELRLHKVPFTMRPAVSHHDNLIRGSFMTTQNKNRDRCNSKRCKKLCTCVAMIQRGNWFAFHVEQISGAFFPPHSYPSLDFAHRINLVAPADEGSTFN